MVIKSPQTTELREKIDDYFTALNELGKFNGVVLAAKGDSEIIHKAYNLNQKISFLMTLKHRNHLNLFRMKMAVMTC